MRSLFKSGAPVICDLQTSELDTFWSDEGSISVALFDIQKYFLFYFFFSLKDQIYVLLNSFSIDANQTCFWKLFKCSVYNLFVL